MAPEAADGSTSPILDDNLKLVVTFRFAEQWHIGRVNETDDVSADDSAGEKFPAGGGLTSGRGVIIAPVHLQGLAADEVAKIIRHRAEDMALLAEAMTIANIQFREALDSIAVPSVPTDDPS